MATSNFGSLAMADCIYAFCMEDNEYREDEYDFIKNLVTDALTPLGFCIGDTIRSGSQENIAYKGFDVFDHKRKEWVTVYAYVYIETGYYSGARFDFCIDPIENISKTTAQKIERLKKKINKILAKHTTKMYVTARFSNGETIYSLF